MIAPRHKKPTKGPVRSDTAEREMLHQLATKQAPTYGVWRPVASEAEVLSEIVTEIGETLLARRIRVTARNSAAVADMTVSNRHLVTLEGIRTGEPLDTAEVVVQALAQEFVSAEALKFEITARAPTLTHTARSWSHVVLHEAVQARGAAQDCARTSLIREFQDIALSWINLTTHEENGDANQLALLKKSTVALPSQGHGTTPLQCNQPRLTLIPMDETMLFVEMCLDHTRIQLTANRHDRARLVTRWQAFSAASLTET